MKTYIVVGGSKGIGNTIVNNLLENHKVVNISRTAPVQTNTNLIHHNCDILSDALPELDAVDGLI